MIFGIFVIKEKLSNYDIKKKLFRYIDVFAKSAPYKSSYRYSSLW